MTLPVSLLLVFRTHRRATIITVSVRQLPEVNWPGARATGKVISS